MVDTRALIAALEDGLVSSAVIDVWEHEPDIDLDQTGARHYPYLTTRLRRQGKPHASAGCPLPLLPHRGRLSDFASPPPEPRRHRRLDSRSLPQMYDPRRDSDALKARPEQFEALRGDYPLRREEEAYEVVVSG